MKKNIVKLVTALATIAIVQVACKKAGVTPHSGTDYQIEELALQASNPIDANEVITNETTGEWILENEGINANYWVEPSDWDLKQGPSGGEDESTLKRKRIIAKSFINCLHKLDLSDRQTTAIRTILGDYHDCKASAIARARAIYSNLAQSYKDKFARLQAAYKAGKITKEQLEKATAELRLEFVKELRSMQLKEKLDIALSTCHRAMLAKIKNILSEKQWIAFVSCLK